MMMHCGAAALALFCCVAVDVRAGDAVSFQVRVDLSKAPDATVHGERAKALCLQWYPKINDILYGSAHELPYSEIVVVFQHQPIVGFTVGNVIHISSDWIRQQPKEYDGVVIHELAHVAQEYTNLKLGHDRLFAMFRPLRIKLSQETRMNWLAEGIADYVRWKCYRDDLEPRLQINDADYAKLRYRGYKRGYKIAASFLLWLEMEKDRDIIRKLDTVLKQRRYSAKVFELSCGAPLDKLWQGFIAQSRAPGVQAWPQADTSARSADMRNIASPDDTLSSGLAREVE